MLVGIPTHHLCWSLLFAAEPTAVVRIRKGREKLPVYELPIVRGKVDVAPLAKAEEVKFKEIAIKDSAAEELQYQQFSAYLVPVEPGQEVYLKAKAAGTPAAAAAAAVSVLTESC